MNDAVPLPLLRITDPDRDRYANSRLIPWWDQERLAAAQVMVVGAGALGNEVVKNLALLGVGHLFIVDFDRIEMSNLTRSALFRAADQGRPKAEVAAERARELNPDVHVRAFPGDVVDGLGLGVFRSMDVVVGCLDNREARWAVNRACWRLGKPWVDGGLTELGGAVKVFVPPAGACYECGLTDQDRFLMAWRNSCPMLRPEDLVLGRVPTTITGAAIIAGVQVQETLKLLHGRPVAAGGGFLYDGATRSASNVSLARRADCTAHQPWAPIVELPAGVRTLSLAGLLREAQARLGDGAAVHLDGTVAVRAVCPICAWEERWMRPFPAAWRHEMVCPRCGGAPYPDLAHIFTAEMPYLDTPLAELGVPPYHIVEARADGASAYLELTGDAAELLTYTGDDRR